MLEACWKILLELSPWLLLGMAISGAMHVWLPTDFVKKRFQGAAGVVRAVAIGIPLPLCSCGVIPAGIGLKKDGADDGAAMGFLISTPQTGVDSIFVSISFFGWPFAIFKMVAALVMGVTGGLIANLNPHKRRLGVTDAVDCCEPKSNNRLGPVSRFFVHALEIFRSIWGWMLIGIVLSAAITVYVSDDWLTWISEFGSGPAMIVVLLISIPLYVCATASVPLAAALVAGGFPTSAAIVFLMAGPATNTATMGAIFSRFGFRLLIVYLLVVIVGSFISGVVCDWLVDATAVQDRLQSSEHGNWIEVVCSLIVAALFAYCFWQDTKRRLRTAFGSKPAAVPTPDCCAETHSEK